MKAEAIASGNKFEFSVFNDTSMIQQLFNEIAQKGLLTLEYYENLFGFLIFWYFFS